MLATLDPATVTSKLLLKRMKDLEAAGPAFAATPVASLPVNGGHGSFIPAGAAGRVSLLELVNDGFLYPRDTHAPRGGDGTPSVVHRAALTDAAGTPTAVVSQSDVARFLSAHEGQLGAFGARTVGDAGWASRGAVISVTPETSALAALALMKEKGVSGVAVVDGADGRLVGNFSVSDLRSIVAEHFGALALPVAEMLAMERGFEYWGIDHRAPEAAPAASASAFARAASRRRATLGGDVGQDIAFATADDTVASVLAKLVSRRLHRLYIVDGDTKKPVGLVTLTDLLREAVAAAK
jgi:CBS domain-containing protein